MNYDDYITNYEEFENEFSSDSFHKFKISEEGFPDVYIPVTRDYRDILLFSELMSQVPEFTVTNAMIGDNYNGAQVYTYKNLADRNRILTFTILTEGTASLLSLIQVDDNPSMIQIVDNTFWFCMKAKQPITCESSTSPYADFSDFPYLYEHEGPIIVNGVSYTVAELDLHSEEFNDPPISFEADSDGIFFVNRKEECQLIEFQYNINDVYIPDPSSYGSEGGWNEEGTSYLLSLAPQEFTTPVLEISFIDSNGWTTDQLQEDSENYIRIRVVSDNPDPNWNATVTFAGQTVYLDLNETEVDILFRTPVNKTWYGFYYDYNLDVQSEYSWSYYQGGLPLVVIKGITLPDTIATLSESGSSYSTVIQSSSYYNGLNPFFHFSTETHFSKYSTVNITLDPAFAGFKFKEPFQDISVDSQGKATIALSRLPKYQTSWTSDERAYASAQIEREDGVVIASISFRTTHDKVEMYIESETNPNTYYSSDNRLYGILNQPYRKLRFGFFDSRVKKVRIRMGNNPGPVGTTVVPERLILDVQPDNYVYYTPPTPTDVYNAEVSPGSWSYYSTRIVFDIIEADDPLLVGRVTQTGAFKLVVSSG